MSFYNGVNLNQELCVRIINFMYHFNNQIFRDFHVSPPPTHFSTNLHDSQIFRRIWLSL
nr:MAG TPA: hypothetical protein [Caudoviricetes sp.]